MASIEKRRGNDGKIHYRVRIRKQGAPQINKTFRRLADARTYAQRTEADISSGGIIANPARQQHTLQAAIDRYLASQTHAAKAANTRRIERYCLRWWGARLGSHRLRDITRLMIVEEQERLARTRKPNTVRSYITWLRYLYKLAQVEWEWITETPFRRPIVVREGEARIRFLSDDERTRLLAACRADHYGYIYEQVAIAISTGARQMEIVQLQWRQVDLARNQITFDRTKTRAPRTVALAGLGLDAVQSRYANRTPSHWLFPRAKSDAAPTFNQSAWERVRRQANLEDFLFHDLRHTAASYLAMSGASLLDIMYILGHKNISMTQRYAHLTRDHTRDVLERMNLSMIPDKKAAS